MFMELPSISAFINIIAKSFQLVMKYLLSYIYRAGATEMFFTEGVLFLLQPGAIQEKH
jgi:DNA-binding ferritin-like protein (Dps family)